MNRFCSAFFVIL